MSAAGPLALSLDVSAVPARPGGAGRYTIALGRGLAAQPDVTLTLVARRTDTSRWEAVGAQHLRPEVPTSRPGRLVFEQVGLPALLRSTSVRVHHGPHYTMPARSPVPCVVTIHDCTFFDHPEWHLRTKAAFFRRAIRRAAQHAAALVCVSQVTAERLAANCPVRAPVVVAPHGVDHGRFSPAEPGPGADEAALHGLGVPADRPFVAFIGTLEPRKGVAPLVGAFDALAASRPDLVLVLAGQTGWGMEDTERALASARHGDRIVRTGYLPDEAVPAMLRRAAVVAYPALEEGFGLPALEALACGAPLVTTEGTAMAELAGGAALLVPPGVVDSLAEALAAALDAGRETDRVALGLQVAARRTWEASVAEHRRAYALAEQAPL
ncbi:MAG TPA: glycosyltransferase family 1 protein [Acidimicrobiales bacterium]|jgi:glycosyltransferase involved in cell wall biosynthesis|nr:glycosyltransferase family 1 protein [Acidimicrobiales bacterium]